jgi:hypothetical protein
VIDMERGEHSADAIDAARRRRIDGIFRALRTDLSIDRATRARLIDEIAALIDAS